MKKEIMTGDWIYMTPQEVDLRQIKEALDAKEKYDIEIWDEAGVLEVGMPDGNSFDIEEAKIHPKDEITAAFAAKHHVKQVFLATFCPESFEEAEQVMQAILAACGGFFCGDTDDFQPQISGRE